jgi:hypothetical protein
MSDESMEDALNAVSLEAENEELRQALVRTQRQLSKAKAKEEAVVKAVYEAAYDSLVALGAPKLVKAPAKDSRPRGEHFALWDLGDWQGTKVTTSYNTAVMKERVHLYLEKASYFLEEQRKSRPVRHCAVVFGGDMIEGLWNYPTQAWEVEHEPIAQVVEVAALMADVVRSALSQFETVSVTPEWGNHGRVGSKRDGVPKETNLDRMAFILARQQLIAEVDSGRLTWEDSADDIQRLEVGNYRALVIHGDEIGRNGYASPSTIVQHVNRWKSAYPWDFRDVYCHHYHTLMELTLADGKGRVYFNGATESDNRYALVGMAASGTPSQRLHFIDPEKGLVVQRVDILLDGS